MSKRWSINVRMAEAGGALLDCIDRLDAVTMTLQAVRKDAHEVISTVTLLRQSHAFLHSAARMLMGVPDQSLFAERMTGDEFTSAVRQLDRETR